MADNRGKKKESEPELPLDGQGADTSDTVDEASQPSVTPGGAAGTRDSALPMEEGPWPSQEEPESTDAEERPESAAGERAEPAPEETSEDEPAAPKVVPVGRPGPPTPQPPAGETLNRAKDLARAGRTQEAIEVYSALVAENPTHIKARNNLGVLYDEIGAHEMALEHFTAARELDPENVEILTNLGASLGALGRFDDAEREFRKALRINPENVDLRANMGILYFRRGLYSHAEVELRWVCERDENHAAAFFYRGEALNRLSRVDEALEALTRATQLQPRNARAYYTMGILYDKKHLPEQAEAMYRKSREMASP